MVADEAGRPGHEDRVLRHACWSLCCGYRLSKPAIISPAPDFPFSFAAKQAITMRYWLTALINRCRSKRGLAFMVSFSIALLTIAVRVTGRSRHAAASIRPQESG